jgi:hypothetical protein
MAMLVLKHMVLDFGFPSVYYHHLLEDHYHYVLEACYHLCQMVQ